MSPKKSSAFGTIRTLSKRAQNMLSRAKQGEEDTSKTKKTARKAATKKDEEILVHISVQSVVKAAFAVLAVAIGAWLVFHLRDKILLLLLAFFLATVVDPGVSRLEGWGMPRSVAILLLYFFALFILVFLVVSLIPVIATQIQDIARIINRDLGPFLADPVVSLPLLTADINAQLTEMARALFQDVSVDQITDSLQTVGQDLRDIASESVQFAARVAGSVFNFIFNLIVVLVLAFFIQMEKEKIIHWLRGFLPTRLRTYADIKSEAIHIKMGQWMRGQLLLMFSIFLLTFIALITLGLGDYALTLATLAGFFELLPAVGPFLAAIPAIIIAGTQKGLLWIPIVAGVYYVIQWCENNLLVPLIMRRAVGLSPIAILFAMLVGISFPDTIHPVLGVLLAVPITTIIALFLEDWRNGKK